MKQLGMKVPEEDYEAIEKYTQENNCSKSQAGRVVISRGLKYPKLEAENESLREEIIGLESKNERVEAESEELRTEIYDLKEEQRQFMGDIFLKMLENIGGWNNQHPPRSQG